MGVFVMGFPSLTSVAPYDHTDWMAANEKPLLADVQILQCSFCGLARHAVKWMIRCPDELYICNVCVDLAQVAIERGEASNNLVTLRRDNRRIQKMEELERVQEKLSRLLEELNRLGESEECRFCGARSTLVRRAGSDVNICDECLHACQQMATEQGLDAPA
ncbi:hypothetical protein GCM10009780_77430 [Actinomadura alba]